MFFLSKARPGSFGTQALKSGVKSIQKRPISYGPGINLKELDLARKKSPTFDKQFQKVEAQEANLRKKITLISPDHDIHKIPGYKEAFLKKRELKVEYHPGISPHYSPEQHKVSLMTPKNMDETGHEMQHAVDLTSGVIDKGNPKEKLFSELRSFHAQKKIYQELNRTNSSPPLFENRSPREMAASYQGKSNYPGTTKESQEIVQKRLGPKFPGLDDI